MINFQTIQNTKLQLDSRPNGMCSRRERRYSKPYFPCALQRTAETGRFMRTPRQSCPAVLRTNGNEGVRWKMISIYSKVHSIRKEHE